VPILDYISSLNKHDTYTKHNVQNTAKQLTNTQQCHNHENKHCTAHMHAEKQTTSHSHACKRDQNTQDESKDHKTAHTITCTDKIKRTLTKERGYISSTPRQQCRARKRPENTAPQNTKHEDACGRTQSQERPCITKAKQQPTQIKSTTHLHTQTQRHTLYIRAAKLHVATSAKHHTQNTQINVQTRKLRQPCHQTVFLFLVIRQSCSRSWIWLPQRH